MNRRWFLVGVCFAILGLQKLSAQSSEPVRQWLFLRERDHSTLSPSDLGISDRALRRRAKVLPADKLVDAYDLPPSAVLIKQIQSSGAKVHSISRWLNAVSVEATSGQLNALRQLPEVAHSQPVARITKPRPETAPAPPGTFLQKNERRSLLDYGPSYTQLKSTKIVDVHSLAINGTGVLVGLLDDGFNNHRAHPALKDIRVVAEYDFVQRDSSTTRAPNETSAQGNHGAGVLSSIGGFHNGFLIGAGFGASFVLAKTEDISREVNVEEDNYVEGLEWMERLGVDIASSSLGYRQFDNGQISYTYQDMNGRTTIVSRAASVAARKGVLLCTAMGNEGFQTGRPAVSAPGTLVAPADADSIIGVGATSSDEILASFSGTGPTSDGRIKPDIVAQGTGVYWSNGTASGYYYVNGTSASTPLVAGVAALLLSARPELTPVQLRNALLNTAIQRDDGTSQTTTYPNNYYGWGGVNALNAILYHGLVFSNQPSVREVSSSLTISTFIRSNAALVGDSLFVYYQRAAEGPFERALLTPTSTPYLYRATIGAGSDTNYPRGYFSARDVNGTVRRHPHNAPDSLLNFRSAIYSGVPGFPEPPTTYELSHNYPNPFNGETTIDFYAPTQEPVELTIYNLLGQPVRTLFSGIPRVGNNSRRWNGKDHGGRTLATGMYIYRLKTQGSVLSKKMLYIK